MQNSLQDFSVSAGSLPHLLSLIPVPIRLLFSQFWMVFLSVVRLVILSSLSI